jgi:Down syndrome cell adhesion protein
VGIVSGPHVHVLENGSLVILDADKSDEGEYLCGSSNTIGSVVSRPVYVRVNTAAHFAKNFESLRARVGDKVTMICEAFGDDPVKLTWSKDKELLTNSQFSHRKKYVIQENSGRSPGSALSSRLSLESVDISDSGFYICSASNQFGRDDLNFQVVVQGNPEAPVNLRASEVHGRRISVEWKESLDGNSPLIEYILNYRKNDGENIKCTGLKKERYL